MPAPISRRRFFLLLTVVVASVFGCYPSVWKTNISDFTGENIGAQYTSFEGEVLVFPLWKQHRDTKCESNYFIAPPVFLTQDEVPSLSDTIAKYKNRATMYLFMHPTWRLSSTLIGIYFVFPDGTLSWVRYFSSTPDDLWREMKRGVLGAGWKKDLLFEVERAGFVLKADAAQTEFFAPQFAPTGDRRCPVTAGSLDCCYHEFVPFEFTSDEQKSRVKSYLEQLPIHSGPATDRWEVSNFDVDA